MSKPRDYALRFVGGSAIAFAGLGLWYSGATLCTFFPHDPRTPYFPHAFYTMSAICLACYVTLLVIGIRFVRLKSSSVHLFIGVMIFEVVYVFGLAILWMTPGIGRSVAAATGVANGGLAFQFLVLFPLWGPLLAHCATNNTQADVPDSDVLYIASEQVERPSDWAWAVVNFIVIAAVTFSLLVLAYQRSRRGPVQPFATLVGVPLVLGLANAFASVKGRRKRRRKRIERRHASRLRMGLCPRCEYDLRGLTENRCPECGQPFAEVPEPPQ